MKITIKSGDGYYYTENIIPVNPEMVNVRPIEEEKSEDFGAVLNDETQKITGEAVTKDRLTTTDPDYVSMAPEALAPIFKKAAETYGLDQKLLETVAMRESNFRPDAVSSAGAIGVMQLMPGTAQSQGVTNPYDAEQNIMGGAKLLRNLYDGFDGNLELMLAAYNAGAGAVRKYGGVPPYTETQNYVKWITERYP